MLAAMGRFGAVGGMRWRWAPPPARGSPPTAHFIKGKSVDHWVVEHWRDSDSRSVRVDAEVLGTTLVPDATDLAPDEFLTGGEAQRHRVGSINPDSFGVAGVVACYSRDGEPVAG